MERQKQLARWLVCGMACLLATAPALARSSAGARAITVDVPANTPVEDTVYLQSGPFISWSMTRVDADTWTLTLAESDLFNSAYGVGESYRGPSYDPKSRVLLYSYTRWGFQRERAEALVEEPERGSEWFRARDIAFAPVTQLHDRVERWLWLLGSGVALPSHAAAFTGWKPRIDGQDFQAGVWVTDYWFDAMKPVLGSSNLSVKHAAPANFGES